MKIHRVKETAEVDNAAVNTDQSLLHDQTLGWGFLTRLTAISLVSIMMGIK